MASKRFHGMVVIVTGAGSGFEPTREGIAAVEDRHLVPADALGVALPR